MSAGLPSIVDDPKIRSYILQSAGEEGVKVVQLLEGRKEATDSELAEVLGAKPSHVRKVLYNLFEARVAEYTKEKDKESGWLTFFWHVTPDNAEHALSQRRRREMEGLRLQIESEKGHDWYACPDGHGRLDFTAASEAGFHCATCGSMLQHDDNAKRLTDMQANLKAMESHRE